MRSTESIPGIYPLITHREPTQNGNGKDNLGMGYTQHGEQFMLKPGNQTGVAEFVGARVADACGVPACQPTIVTIDDWRGVRHLFGSRIESGRHQFDQVSVTEWRTVMSNCSNPGAFSAMMAIDLVLGNDDRHWNNWLVQEAADASGIKRFRLRALDFSRSWPVRHPAQHPLRHQHHNTWKSAKDWELLGIDFDHEIFCETCARITRLDSRWLRSAVMPPIAGVFLSQAQSDAYCQWWELCLQNQVIEAINSLEYGVWQ